MSHFSPSLFSENGNEVDMKYWMAYSATIPQDSFSVELILKDKYILLIN